MLDTRVLTQYLLGRKIIPLKELYALLEEDINSEDVGSVLDQIRNVLVPFHIDLRRAFDNNGDEVLILFDHMNDEISRMGCPFSKEQLVAFKAIVDLIATNPKRYASTMELLNKLADLLQYSKREFESLVTSLVDGKWLEQTLNGKLRLGMRSEIELAEYLKAEFSFDECCVCKRIVASQGLQCANDECHSFHEECLNRITSSKNCPYCFCQIAPTASLAKLKENNE